jgi:hypothetical protein
VLERILWDGVALTRAGRPMKSWRHTECVSSVVRGKGLENENHKVALVVSCLSIPTLTVETQVRAVQITMNSEGQTGLGRCGEQQVYRC